jgi:hypothetical protein
LFCYFWVGLGRYNARCYWVEHFGMAWLENCMVWRWFEMVCEIIQWLLGTV